MILEIKPSTMAMVDWEPAIPITPDYAETRLDMARHVLRRGSSRGVVWHGQRLYTLLNALELLEDEIMDLTPDVWRSTSMHEARWSVCTDRRHRSKTFGFNNAKTKGLLAGSVSRPKFGLARQLPLRTALSHFRVRGGNDLRAHLDSLWDVLEGGPRMLANFPSVHRGNSGRCRRHCGAKCWNCLWLRALRRGLIFDRDRDVQQVS